MRGRRWPRFEPARKRNPKDRVPTPGDRGPPLGCAAAQRLRLSLGTPLVCPRVLAPTLAEAEGHVTNRVMHPLVVATSGGVDIEIEGRLNAIIPSTLCRPGLRISDVKDPGEVTRPSATLASSEGLKISRSFAVASSRLRPTSSGRRRFRQEAFAKRRRPVLDAKRPSPSGWGGSAAIYRFRCYRGIYPRLVRCGVQARGDREQAPAMRTDISGASRLPRGAAVRKLDSAQAWSSSRHRAGRARSSHAAYALTCPRLTSGLIFLGQLQQAFARGPVADLPDQLAAFRRETIIVVWIVGRAHFGEGAARRSLASSAIRRCSAFR